MTQQVIDKITLGGLKLATISTAILLIVIVFTYTVLPKIQEFKKSKRSYNQLHELMEDKSDVSGRIKAIYDEVAVLKRKLHGGMADLQSKQMQSFILSQLQKISWENDVQIEGVTLAIGVKIKLFQEALFKVKLIGKYNNLYHWIEALNKQFGFIVINEFEMRPREVGGSDPILSTELVIATYRYIS